MAYSSNNNAVLFDDCNVLHNLTVLLEVGTEIATQNNSGWSFQVNCFVPPGYSCQGSPINWAQFIIDISGGYLWWEIQYWSIGSSNWPPGYTPEAGTSPWLPCWASDFELTQFAAGLNGDLLPSGSLLQITLNTDLNGGVESASFIYVDPNGVTNTEVWTLPVTFPISAFQVNIVGVDDSPWYGWAIFNNQIPVALIRSSVLSGQLSVQSPGSTLCVPETTGEQSNMVYSDISGAPGSSVSQTFQPPLQLPPFVTTGTLTFKPQQLNTDSPQQTVLVVVGPGIAVTGISLITVEDSSQFVCVPPIGTTDLQLSNGVLAITVLYHPTVVGPRNASLQISHSDSDTPLNVQLLGTGQEALLPLLNFSPGSLIFTTTRITKHTVSLTNTGTAALSVDSIAIEGPSEFTFGSTCQVGTGTVSLEPGQECTVTVSFHGAVSAEATLIITHNAADSPALIALQAIVGKGPEQ